MKDPGHLFKDYFDAEKRRDIKAQEEAVAKLWQYLAETQGDKPSPWLVAMSRAHDCEAVYDWAGAEAAYRHAIHVEADSPGMQSRAYDQLRQLFLLLNQEDSALEAARSATATARLANLPAMLAPALIAESWMHFRRDHLAQAQALLREALAIVEKDSPANVTRASALTLGAELQFCEGKIAESEADLVAAWQILEPHQEATFAGGWQAALAGWWSLTARLRRQQGRDQDVADAWREAVTRRRIVAGLPQIEGPYIRNSLAVALRDMGRFFAESSDPSAQECFRESDSIRRVIGLAVLER